MGRRLTGYEDGGAEQPPDERVPLIESAVASRFSSKQPQRIWRLFPANQRLHAANERNRRGTSREATHEDDQRERNEKKRAQREEVVVVRIRRLVVEHRVEEGALLDEQGEGGVGVHIACCRQP